MLPIPSIVVIASPFIEHRGTKQAVTAECLRFAVKVVRNIIRTFNFFFRFMSLGNDQIF